MNFYSYLDCFEDKVVDQANSKNTLVQQELYTKNGKIPIKVIDCFKDKYVNYWGVSTKSSSFNY